MNELPIGVNADLNQLLCMVYGDLISPSFRKIGQAFGILAGFLPTLLLPLKLKSELADINFKYCIDKYQKELESISDEEIVEVPPALGLPILDKFTQVTDDYIREMYVSLLFSASSKSTANLAHPSALRIIESLSPDEAKIINYIRSETNVPFITLQHKLGNKRGFRTIDKYLLGIENKVELAFPENMPLYIDNLLASGLYHYESGLFLTNNVIYLELEKTYSVLIEQRKNSLIAHGSDSELIIKHEIITKSKLGERFIKTCCTKQ